MVEMIASTSGGAMELERLLACYLLLGVSENLDEIPEHERKESGHVRVHR
jgi:hypothetical protein